MNELFLKIINMSISASWLVLAVLILFWPGVLKALLVLLATAVVLLIMILNPVINPFTLIQHKAVMRPTQREYELGLEIMKRVKEL